MLSLGVLETVVEETEEDAEKIAPENIPQLLELPKNVLVQLELLEQQM